jgi:hypothetical protein
VSGASGETSERACPPFGRLHCMVQTGRIQSDQAGRKNIERVHGISIDRPVLVNRSSRPELISLRCIDCAALLRNGRVDMLELLGIASRSAASEQPAAA